MTATGHIEPEVAALLRGCAIVNVASDPQGTRLTLVSPTGERMVLQAWCDEEGNGPGYLAIVEYREAPGG